MYEQGLPKDWFATGVGEAASLGLHESQSRFGKTSLVVRFHSANGSPSDSRCTSKRGLPETLFGASNRVERSLIRVMADESTYNLHIIVRFQLERALIDGDLSVSEAEAAWSEAYERIVGFDRAPPSEGISRTCTGAAVPLGTFLPTPLATCMRHLWAPVWKKHNPHFGRTWKPATSPRFSPGLKEHPRARAHARRSSPGQGCCRRQRPGRRPDGSPTRASFAGLQKLSRASSPKAPAVYS